MAENFINILGKCFHMAYESNYLRILIVVCLTSFYFLFYKKRKFNLPPGPNGLPFIGYYPFIDRVLPHKQFKLLSEKYGSIFSLNICSRLVVVCNDWETAKDAFSQSAVTNRPPGLFNALRNGFGFGSENGHVWSQQRQFSVRTMKDLGLGKSKWENFLEVEVKETIESIKKHGTQPIDITPFFSNTFTSNILTLLFGYRLPTGHEAVTYISSTLDAIMQEFAVIRLANYLPKLCGFLTRIGLYGSAKTMNLFKDYDYFTENWVKQRLADHELEDEDSFVYQYFQEVQSNKIKGSDKIFPEGSLYGNSQVLLLGGSETTRTSLIWLLIAMADHPRIQFQVQQELDSVLGKDRMIHWAERSTIPFTFACILESQRRNITVPLNTIRMAGEDVKISGYDVPKGSFIINNNWAIHHDTKYWKEPHNFDPYRFLTDNGTKIKFKSESYLPFSYGRRMCPGEQIAMMEILCYFTNIMQNFTVRPESGDTVRHGAILGLTHQATDVKLRFALREWKS